MTQRVQHLRTTSYNFDRQVTSKGGIPNKLGRRTIRKSPDGIGLMGVSHINPRA